MDSKDKIYSIVAQTFEISIESISNEMTSNDVQNWDSLRQFILVSAIENEFRIKLSVEDIFKIISIQSIIDLIEEKLAK